MELIILHIHNQLFILEYCPLWIYFIRSFLQDAPVCSVYLWSFSLPRSPGLVSSLLARPSGQRCVSFLPVLPTGWAGRNRLAGWTTPPHGRSPSSAPQPWLLSSSAGATWGKGKVGKCKDGEGWELLRSCHSLLHMLAANFILVTCRHDRMKLILWGKNGSKSCFQVVVMPPGCQKIY